MRFRVVLDIMCYPFYKWRDRRNFNKRMKELKKRDPYIYK